MNPYHHLAAEYARCVREGRSWPLGGFADLPRPPIPAGAPKALIFSPHPDDEVIIGGLALRLMREAGHAIVNVAVTQGSNKARQEERWIELEGCCAHIGFGLTATRPGGLERINPVTREQDPVHWRACVQVIAGILEREQPRIIFLPHDADWNSTHEGTHHLVMDALRSLPPGFGCYVVETEFWGQMEDPNLMVESSVGEVGDLITALTFHVGEVRRNPYHLLVPPWMMDNVRRGCELVGGQGGSAPDFVYATLYRLRAWRDHGLVPLYSAGRYLPSGVSAGTLFAG